MIEIPFVPKTLLGFKFRIARAFCNIYREQQGLDKITQNDLAQLIDIPQYLTKNFSTADVSEAENGKLYNYHVPALIAYYQDNGINPSFFLRENFQVDNQGNFFINLPIESPIYETLDLRTFFKDNYRIYVDEHKKKVKYEVKIKIQKS